MCPDQASDRLLSLSPLQFLQELWFEGYTPLSYPGTGDADAWEWQQTRLPEGCEVLYQRLAPLQEIPKLSTFAIAALINLIVTQMPAEHCYLNIGTWYGFTLFAGLLGNPDKTCIGVDDFSRNIISTQRLRLPPSNPEPDFRRWFDRWRSPRHAFYALEFRKYFRLFHAQQPIGLYFYDADHAYHAQYASLVLADPWLAPGAWILVDDINEVQPYAATHDFLRDYGSRYQLRFEQKTRCNGHPSFWNGLILLQKSGHSHAAAEKVSWQT